MARSILTAVMVAVAGVMALFAVNLATSFIPPERYGAVINAAVRDGIMAETIRLPLGPARDIHLVGGSDCQVLVMLVVPRESRVKESISPRWPSLSEEVISRPAPAYGRDPFCRILARAMEANAAARPLELEYHHRYLHAPVMLAALTLPVVPLHIALNAVLLLCYLGLAGVVIAAATRLRATEPDEARRALAFLIWAAVLALFYALPIYGRTFSHGPGDLALIGFMLVGYLWPLCRLPEHCFVLVVSMFGTMIVLLELLTGSIPIAFATLIALVALGRPASGAVMVRRQALAVACFGVAGFACFALKFAVMTVVFGVGEVADFFTVLRDRMGGPLVPWPALEQLAARWGIDADLINRSLLARWALSGGMLTYSSFVLGWGSHALGATLVLVPTPVLIALTIMALRRAPRAHWLVLPHPWLLAAGLVPFVWYAMFTMHTTTHPIFMVRPLALNVALAAIAAVLLPARRTHLASATHDATAPTPVSR